MSKKPILSIVVLNYNTKELLRNCLSSIKKVEGEVKFQVIVSDNGSSDGSVEMLYKEFPNVEIVKQRRNLGFAAGNNRAKKICKGKYVLFLNSDTIVYKNTLKKTVGYLEREKKVGALTCKITLPDGKLDKDTRRSFITPWIGFTHVFLKIDKLFPTSELFGRYWYGYISENKTHEVDVIQGAYFLVRKKILDNVGWFDEDYFLDGEDIDLCWKIKSKGWKIIYYPKVKILHLKGASKGKVESKTKKSVPLKERLKYRMAGVDSMEMFYRKKLWNQYPLILNVFVIVGIKIVKTFRFTRTLLLG